MIDFVPILRESWASHRKSGQQQGSGTALKGPLNRLPRENPLGLAAVETTTTNNGKNGNRQVPTAR